jgi:hypothetical protein
MSLAIGGDRPAEKMYDRDSGIRTIRYHQRSTSRWSMSSNTVAREPHLCCKVSRLALVATLVCSDWSFVPHHTNRLRWYQIFIGLVLLLSGTPQVGKLRQSRGA